MVKTKGNELVFAPLGGVGEIGMNLALYGFGPPQKREWIIVDCGVTFPGPDLPGVDLVLPDIRFIESEVKNLKGMIITHAHEDHYGAVLDLWPRLKCPVWMSPFTAGLMEAKRESEYQRVKVPVTIFKPRERFEVGPFVVEPIPVTHSIPEPYSLAIATPLGTVIHTGDWKFDEAPSIGPLTDAAGFSAYGDKGVLALICDSTNALRDGESPTEKEVAASLEKLIGKAPGRVIITTFSSNVGRIRSIAEAARDAGRKVLVLGRSLKRVIEVAGDLGYLEGLPEFLDEEEYQYTAREEIVVICTGSQGESRAALAKLARKEMRHVQLAAGDTVIYSSRVIPGNEKPIIETKNLLIEQGVRIIEDQDALVHVSGHPRRGELKRMYELVRPQISVPVHGEAAHLVAHGALAASIGVPQVAQVRDGNMLRLAPGAAEVIGTVPFGRTYKDGRLYGDEQEIGVRDRRKLSYVGHVVVNVILDQKYEVLGEPDLEAVGLPEKDAGGDFLEDILFDAVVGAIESIPRGRRKDLDLVADSARRAVRAEANEIWGKKPIVTVFVTRV